MALALTAVNPTISSVTVPPKTTDGTVPIKRAARPLSKAPNSLLLQINIVLTAATLQRIESGVNI